MKRRTARTALVGLLILSVRITNAVEPPELTRDRPTLGLALGGGAARGIAHIGILTWLEEHRVPIDYIAGTSMGGLVGGAYASGMSPDELGALMRDADWDLIFLSDSPFRYKTFRRKQDARDLPSLIELGLKNGLQLPSGLNAGQGVETIVDRIAAPYPNLESFDDLPTPFRSVATDLETSSVAVLDRGSLSAAMRATMAIPGLFAPVNLDGRVLVDGGTLNNVPADIARDMGADVVVAVNVGSATDGFTTPSSLFDVLGRTMDVMMSMGVDRALESADLVITPDLRGYLGTDYRRGNEIEARGYAAAEAVKDQLLKHATDEDSYAAWRRARLAKRRKVTTKLDAVRVRGIPDDEADRMRRRLERRLVSDGTTLEEVEREVLRLTGTDRYATIRYAIVEVDELHTLDLDVTPKSHGPPFLLPGIELENIDSNSFSLALKGRIAVYDAFVPESELRIDVGFGTTQEAGIELYRKLFDSPLFVAPRGSWRRVSLNGYDSEGQLRAEYREKRTGTGLDFGLTLGTGSELRFGYDVADLRTRLRVGEPSLPEAEGRNRFASIRWTFDGQTSPIIPTRGLFAHAALRYYSDTPEIVFLGEELDGPEDYTQGEVRLSAFHRLRERHRIFYGFAAGSSFGDDPGYNEFRLGGLLRLGAFHNGEIVGNNYLIGYGGILYQIVRLPDVIGSNGYVGGWLETGSAFDQWGNASVEWNASSGIVLETFLGPLFVGGSVSLTNGARRFYVNLGPFVR